MKFLCVACDEAMKVVPAAGAANESSLIVVFRCPRCEHRMALLTNPAETQLVRSLGVAIGGREAPHQPLELVRAGLAEGRLMWTEDAERRLQRVPEFVRPMVRESVERYARERGHEQVTLTVLDEVRAQVGM